MREETYDHDTIEVDKHMRTYTFSTVLLYKLGLWILHLLIYDCILSKAGS